MAKKKSSAAKKAARGRQGEQVRFGQVKRDANGRAVLTKQQQAMIDEAVRRDDLQNFRRKEWGREAAEGWKSAEPNIARNIDDVLEHRKRGTDQDRDELRDLLYTFAFMGYHMAAARVQRRRVKEGKKGNSKKIAEKGERYRLVLAAYDGIDSSLPEDERIRLACAAAGCGRSTYYRAVKALR